MDGTGTKLCPMMGFGIRCVELSDSTNKILVTLSQIQVNVGLSPWHGTSLGCGWRRLPPDMEHSCKYTE